MYKQHKCRIYTNNQLVKVVTNNINSKWVCGNLLITESNEVFFKNQNKAKMQLKGGSKGYYVNRRFRTLKWIKENCITKSEIINTEIIVPF